METLHTYYIHITKILNWKFSFLSYVFLVPIYVLIQLLQFKIIYFGFQLNICFYIELFFCLFFLRYTCFSPSRFFFIFFIVVHIFSLLSGHMLVMNWCEGMVSCNRDKFMVNDRMTMKTVISTTISPSSEEVPVVENKSSTCYRYWTICIFTDSTNSALDLTAVAWRLAKFWLPNCTDECTILMGFFFLQTFILNHF